MELQRMRDLLERVQVGIQELKKKTGTGGDDGGGGGGKTTEDVHMLDPDLALDLERVKVEEIISNNKR